MKKSYVTNSPAPSELSSKSQKEELKNKIPSIKDLQRKKKDRDHPPPTDVPGLDQGFGVRRHLDQVAGSAKETQPRLKTFLSGH